MGPSPLSFSVTDSIKDSTRTLMTNLFSRDSLLNLRNLQMSQLPKSLQIIPEEDELYTLATSSCSSPIRPEKRTFSSSHIEVSFADDENKHDLLSSPRSAPRQSLTPSKYHSYDFGSGTTSPTPSISSSSSDLPSTPTSDDEFSASHFIPRRASIKPLNITKNHPKTASFSSQEEVSDDDESDSEWYTREFSKIISLHSPLPPFFLQQRPPSPRPESLLIEPITSEKLSCVTQSPTLVEPKWQPFKRAAAISHKRSRSVPKEAPPPVPPIPEQFRSSTAPSISQSKSTVNARPRPSSLSLRRPPPRTSIPDDCLIDDVVTDADESSWPSAFDISSYEHPSPASPAFISPAPSSSASTIDPSTALSSVPEVPNSPASMYLDAFEGFGEIEFAVDDVKFDLSIDLPMRLPLSLPNSPIDLETDFALGLEELRKMQDADSTTLVPPIIAISDADEATGRQEPQQCTLPESPVQPLPLTPSTATSFDSYYASGDAEVVKTTSPVEQVKEKNVESPTRPVLCSRWSSSTLASIHEERASRSSKFPAASKLRLYFGGGNSPLSKYRQNQKHQEQKQQQQQQKRSSSIAAIAAAKAAVARAATGVVYHSSSYPHPPSVPSTSIGTSAAVKKAQRQVVVVQPPSSSSFFSYYPRTPTKPSTPSTPSTPMSPPGSPHLNGKRKAAWSRRESDVVIIGDGYDGVGKELRRKGSLTPTVSDAGSDESSSTCSSNGLRRKPIPVEMFLRNVNV